MSFDMREILKLKHKILEDMKRFFDETGVEKVVVGFSGGMDSTVSALLCSEILGWDNVELVHLHFGIFSYRRTIENVKRLAERMGKKVAFLNVEEDQRKVWKHGPSCNLCTKKVKIRRLKEYANGRLVISGANKSDSWGIHGLRYHDGVYSPLFNLNKAEVYSLLVDYGFDLADVKVGEKSGLSREGCKLKHLLKMLISMEYHGHAVAKSNEILLEILDRTTIDAKIANVKIIGPLSRNIALVNISPPPSDEAKEKILERLRDLDEIDEVHIVDREIKLTVMANPGLFNDEKSRRRIEIGKFEKDFSEKVKVEWRKSKNSRLWTFHVVDFEWS